MTFPILKTNENIKITMATAKAVLIIKLFLSFIAALTSFAFSVIARNPILVPSILTFLIVLVITPFQIIDKIGRERNYF